MRRALLTLAAFCATACSLPPEVKSPTEELTSQDAVIFLHGYYGSALREKGGGPRQFIRVPTLLYGHFPVALESGALGLERSPELEVEGLFTSLTVLPRFYAIDIYGRLLEKLQAPDRQVIALVYDWRKDLTLAVRSLSDLVNRLEERGVKRISLVSHSMGGLVSSYYLIYGGAPPSSATLTWEGAHKIKRAVFFGTPFAGAMSILRNMQNGTGYTWNPRLLPAGTVASFPASYFLLPFSSAHLKDSAGKDIAIPLKDPAYWESQGLGLLKDSPVEYLSARREYTNKKVRAAVDYHAKLWADAMPPPGLRILNVVGQGTPTLDSGYLVPHEKEILFRPSDARRNRLPFSALEEDGDGTVTTRSAALPLPLRASGQEVRTTFGHGELFLDPAVEKEYAKFVSLDGK